jgi:hypothetical protein
MTTVSTAVERDIATKWAKQYASGVNSGIVGDVAHAASGGYHISIQDQPSNNYSVIRPDDKAPPGTWPRNTAAAIDQSMNRADMIICYKRVRAVWADHTDSRRKYFNAFNVWDGSGDAVRLDFVANVAVFADDTHKWHTHGELRRRYVNDLKACRAWLSMTGGQTKAAWMTQEGEDMTVADDVWAKFISSPALGKNMAAADWIKQGLAALNEVKALDAKVTAEFLQVNAKLDAQSTVVLTPADRAAIVADLVTALIPEIEAAAERAIRKVAADASTP